MADVTNASGTSGLFSNLISEAFKFATPFAQRVIGQSSTPSQLQSETLRNAALNGSGPNDPTLANQSPLGILDFITGQSGASQAGGGSGLRSGGVSGVMVLLIVAVVVGLVLFIRK